VGVAGAELALLAMVELCSCIEASAKQDKTKTITTIFRNSRFTFILLLRFLFRAKT
jgi:hypothetical protein